MFKRRTLFVVGAGASHEAELPVGAKLAESIAKRLVLREDGTGQARPTEPDLYSQLRRANPQAANELIAAYKKIREGVILSNSIDDFLHVHRNDPHIVEVGKAAIVNAIVAAEAGSRLYVDHSNMYNVPDYKKVADTWYVKLMRVLGAGTSATDAPNALNDVSFIVFNYDRCVEHFLRFALHHLYATSRAQAAEIVCNATIIHPYGLIGTLDEVPFGGNRDRNVDYVQLSRRIKTYTEQLEESDTIKRMKKEVAAAECVVFLGFAFHDQNLALLEPKRALTEREVFATAFGMSDDDASEIKSVLAEWFPEERYEGLAISLNYHVRVENKLKCAELFDYYTKSIAG